jgi:hypothetical protein
MSTEPSDVERVAREFCAVEEYGASYDDICDAERRVLHRMAEIAVQHVERERVIAVTMMREMAAHACEEKTRVFLSPEYATGQPLSSFNERFACKECADAIRALPITQEPTR